MITFQNKRNGRRGGSSCPGLGENRRVGTRRIRIRGKDAPQAFWHRDGSQGSSWLQSLSKAISFRSLSDVSYIFAYFTFCIFLKMIVLYCFSEFNRPSTTSLRSECWSNCKPVWRATAVHRYTHHCFHFQSFVLPIHLVLVPCEKRTAS